MPEAREDGSWALRLGYPTSDTSFALTRAIGWKRERPAVLADLKRMSPGAKLGQTDVVCEVLDAAIRTPADRIMIETDSPYLAPVPHRGKRCEPAHSLCTARCISEARSEALEQFAAHTENTVRSFFRIEN